MRDYLFYLMLYLASCPCHAEANEKIVLAADYWCPFNCEPRSQDEGFILEIIREAFANKNIDIEYIMEPWVKAIEDFNNAKIDGIIAANEGDVRNPVLPSIPVIHSYVSAYTLFSTKWQYDTPQSFGHNMLGLTAGYSYSEDINNYIYSRFFENPDLFYISSKTNAVEDNITKLSRGEIGIYIEDESVVSDFIRKNNVRSIKNSGQVQGPSKLFVAFSPVNAKSEEYARLVTDTYFSMKKSGRLKKLANKYNINRL